MRFLNKLVFRITLTIMIPVVLISIAISVLLYNNISENTEVEYTYYLEEVVFNYVDYIDNSLINISDNANVDALLVEKFDKLSVDELMSLLISNIHSDSLIFGSGIFFDKGISPFKSEISYFYAYRNGDSIKEVIVSKKNDPIIFNYIKMKPEWWKTPSTTYSSGWTKPYSDSLSGSPSMITYFKPFFYSDKFAGIITIDISLEKLEEWISTNEKILETNINPTTLLVSTDSVIILSDVKSWIGKKAFDINSRNGKYNLIQSIDVVSKAIAGETGKQTVFTKDGKDKIIAFYTPLRSTNWTAISIIPYDIIYNNIKNSVAQILFIIVAFNIILIIVMIFIARYISKPIVKLSNISLRIAEGDYTAKIQVKSRDEIGVLANNFKLMKKKLKEREVEIAEANRKYEIIFDNSPVGILYIDQNLRIASHNKRLIEVIGIDIKGSYLGKSIEVLNFKEEQINILRNSINTGKHISYTTESLNNKNVIVQININPIVDNSNNNLGTVITVEDVTEQTKNIELKIKTEAAIKANESKSLFLANMSHEIRTPMNAIMGLSYLMEKTELNPKQNNYMRKIGSSAKLLLGLINDILDFSKIEAGKLTLEHAAFNLEKMLVDINNIFSFTAAQKGLEFILFIHPDVPQEVIGDELRLKQIIINLLSNAIKFTSHGEIEISIHVKEKNTDTISLMFEVRDTGIGMTSDQQLRVFDSFSQADESTTRKYGGTGLGLSISKRLVELMNGEIGLKSKPKVGTTFYFDAKLKYSSPQTKRLSLSIPDLKGTNVLVCDDNSSARLVVSTILKSFAFNPLEFDNGYSLLKKLESQTPNIYELIVLDWQMPEINGVEVAKIINNNESITPKPKILLLTADTDKSIDNEKSLYGINAVLYKPVTYSTLFDVIMNIYGKNIKSDNAISIIQATNSDKLKQFEGARVLLVEDNEINQEIAVELITSMGLNVEVAGNGEIAVKKVLEAPSSEFNIIFMDIQMPVMDGYTATKTIRNNKQYLNVPIVAMTADVMEGVKEKCLEIGMKDFVSKPINPDEVVRAIINWAVIPNSNDIVLSPQHNIVPDKQQNTEKILLPEIHGVNIKSAMGRLNNNKRLYLSLLEKFYLNNQNFVSEINEALAQSDFKTAHNMIHTFKGLSGSIGADELYQISSVVEKCIINTDIKSIDTEMPKLAITTNKLFSSIKNNLNFETEVVRQALDIATVRSIIPELKKLLNEKRPKAKVLVNELKNAGLSGELFDDMITRLNKYDFKNALSLLEKIDKTIK